MLDWGLFEIYKPIHHCCPAYISHQISSFGKPITNKSCDLQTYCDRFSIFGIFNARFVTLDLVRFGLVDWVCYVW